MDKLTTVEFVDTSNYTDNEVIDVVGTILPHEWGPVNTVLALNRSQFEAAFPEAITEEYATVLSAYKAGAGIIEIVRPQGSAEYVRMLGVTRKGVPAIEEPLSIAVPGAGYVVGDTFTITGESEVPQVLTVEVTAINAEGGIVEAILKPNAPGVLTARYSFDATKNYTDTSVKGGAVKVNLETVPTIFAVITAQATKDLVLPLVEKPGYPSMDIAFIQDVIFDIRLRHPGRYSDRIDIAFSETTEPEGTVNHITVFSKITGKDLVQDVHISGSMIPGATLDGQDYFLGNVAIRDTTKVNFTLLKPLAVYPLAVAKSSGVLLVTQELAASIVTGTATSEDYLKYFASSKKSAATLLIPSKATDEINATLVEISAARMDMNSLPAYPTDGPFTKDAIKLAFAPFLDKFALGYAGRDIQTVGNVAVRTSAIGGVAGRYCATHVNASINQVPSAKAWGRYPFPLASTLEDDEVLELHGIGINSVYTTTDGPQIWGVKSLFVRQGSYFAKANVSRIIAYVLNTTFPLLDGVLHTPNTPTKMASIEDDRQALINVLIDKEVLKGDSVATCRKSNNKDVDTMGGELLILDFNLGFYKLIERFKVRITASEASVTVNITE